jgi:predicted transcriptional regulator
VVDVDTFEGLNEKLAVLENIGRGERAIEAGRVISHNKARKIMSRWLK